MWWAASFLSVSYTIITTTRRRRGCRSCDCVTLFCYEKQGSRHFVFEVVTSCSNSEVNDKSLDTILWREKAVDAYRPVLRSHLSSLPLKNPQTFLNMSSFPRFTTSAVALTMRHHRPSIELVLRRQAHTRTFPPLFSSSSTFATAAAGRAHLSSSVVGGGTSSSSSKSRDRPVRRRQAAQSSRAVAIDNDVVTLPSWRRGKNEKERDGRSSGGGAGDSSPYAGAATSGGREAE